MPLTKCARCDKLFNKIQSSVCPPCTPDEDADFDLIRSTLDENPDSNAETVAELSGVDLECVLRMMDTGLIANVSMGETAKCGQCGAPAISAAKKLCQGCLEKLNHKMLEARKTIKMEQKKKIQLGEYSNVRQAIDSRRI